MTESVLRLRPHEVWNALETIDPVAVLAEELIGREVGELDRTERDRGRLTRWAGTADRDGGEHVVLEHPDAALRCLFPSASLRVSQAAALAALAARELLVTGGVTAAVLGVAEVSQPQLALLARHVPDISHVALYLPGGEHQDQLEPRLLDQLELSGIGLTVAPTVAETVFGANLVVAAGDGSVRRDLARLQPGQLARGTVLINGTGAGLCTDLVDQVDQVYVDDLGLLTDHRDRYVVAAHLTELAADQPETRWERRISADLGQLLTGRRPGRQRVDDILLVELLGLTELNTELAYRICRTAHRCGLGVETTN